MKKKENLLRSPYIRLGIVTTVFAFVVAIVVLLFLYGYQSLFTENPHFLLRRVIVRSPGYWNGRSKVIKRKLNLKLGETNIFEINPKDLRNILREEKAFSIKEVDVTRIIPDTLKFDITERIPRALLYNMKSDLVVDENGILLNSKCCINIDRNLPVITGFILKKEEKAYGRIVAQIKPALVLISLVNANYPNFNLRLINLSNPNAITAYMPDPLGKKIIKVTFPFKHFSTTTITNASFQEEKHNLKKKLERLKELYNYLRQRGKTCTEISLMFDNQAIIK